MVLLVPISFPIISLLSKLFLSPFNSSCAFLLITVLSYTGCISLICSEMGKILSSSSITIQFLFLLKDKINLSLNLG